MKNQTHPMQPSNGYVKMDVEALYSLELSVSEFDDYTDRIGVMPLEPETYSFLSLEKVT